MNAPRKLWHNPGGLALPAHKQASTQQASRSLSAHQQAPLRIPLLQHAGLKAEAQVQVGEKVYKGQVLARSQGYPALPIHASTSGLITGIEQHPIPHPSGLTDDCLILEPDGEDDWGEQRLPAWPHYAELDAESLRARIAEAGVVGLGGAVFPAAIKLNVCPETPISHLILNGAECEPYISCDDQLMQEHAADIIAGAQIMLHILAAHAPPTGQSCLVGIEDNKPAAIQAMQAAVKMSGDTRIQIISIPTRYPNGGEKQLIHRLTGREVPSAGRPADIGVICHNVATARAIYRAVVLGEPLIDRYVTVTGPGVRHPQNVSVPFGLPISALIEQAGGYTDAAERLLMGGSMMGIPLANASIPVVKATNCILLDRAPPQHIAMPCIRCGQCAEVCPAGLLPQQLYWHARARDFEQAEKHHVMDCIECGCCDVVCPSHIPLVDYYRFAKDEIKAQRAAQQKAAHARERYEMRQARLERLEREKAEKLAKHKQALQDKAANTATANNSKQDAIQAALQRAKAKKAQQAQASKTASNEQDAS